MSKLDRRKHVLNATVAMEATHTLVYVQQWGKPVTFDTRKITLQQFVGESSNESPTREVGISPDENTKNNTNQGIK